MARDYVTRRGLLKAAAGLVAAVGFWGTGNAQDDNKRKVSREEELEGFYNSMTTEQRREFDMFNLAYSRAIDSTKTPALKIFKTKGDGKITREYKREIPDLDLNKPGYSDRMAIFKKEVIDSNGERINWEYIRKYGKDRKFGEKDGPDSIRGSDGDKYQRQGDSNIFKSKKGKKIAVD